MQGCEPKAAENPINERAQGQEQLEPQLQRIEPQIVPEDVENEQQLGWEDFDISGGTTERSYNELQVQVKRNSDLDDGTENYVKCKANYPKEGVHLSVSRQVFRSAKKDKGKPTKFNDGLDRQQISCIIF